MQRIIKNYPIFDIEPDLVTEWHPSSNGKLTPRNVTLAYTKKVWWICKQGHEWKATIKSRKKKRGCPGCANKYTGHILHRTKGISWSETVQGARQVYPEDLVNPEVSDTFYGEMGRDFRKSRRRRIKAIAMLEIPTSGQLFYSQIRNYSHGGLYLETEVAFKNGTLTTLKLDKPLFPDGEKHYQSTTRWCDELDDDVLPTLLYGVGMKFI